MHRAKLSDLWAPAAPCCHSHASCPYGQGEALTPARANSGHARPCTHDTDSWYSSSRLRRGTSTRRRTSAFFPL
eukprot:1179685-Alexandrium_andersonii.AAC.1